MSLIWNNENVQTQRAIKQSVNDKRYSATQLKALADWLLLVSSAGYIGIILAFVSVVMSGKDVPEILYLVGLAVSLLSLWFLRVGLRESEAAKQKADRERKRDFAVLYPKAALMHHLAQYKGYQSAGRRPWSCH